MIFRNMLGKVLEGLSNFSPVKNLIKYILDRSLNELLSNQISLEDFKNGELFLTNINLNLQKINKDFLLSSPYILHKGEVRRLKITLPSWSDLSSKSIEITAEGLHIDLKPNKQFADNFKEAMREQRTDIYQQEQSGAIDNPLDFFRQLVKQIILNMKIRIENSVIRLFINEPTKQVSAKPQYYLMFRLPLLTIGKSDDVVAVKDENIQEIKFDLIIPQMSLHLLKQNAEFPQFSNENVTKGDFPFIYPPVNHPSTILLIGQTKKLEIIDKQKSTKLTITLTTFFKKQKKIVSIQGKINSFEAVIDPIQLKIISRFFAQLMQFQKILKTVMTQMGLNPQVPENLNKKDSKGKSGNYDLFSSIMMSIAQPASKPAPSAEIGIYNNMMQSPQMLQAATEFNQNAVQQLRKSGEFEEQGWKNINFKQELKISFRLNLLQANFLKYVTASSYERKWSAQQHYDKVNQSLGCSHYRLLLKGLEYNFNSASNLHEVKIRFVKLQDARLKNQQSFHHSVSEQFYDLDSSTFYNVNINQDYFTKQPELHSFKMTNEQHYCLEELFRLSEGQDPQIMSPRVKTYAFMPPGAQCGEGAGLAVTFNGHSKALKVQIKDVAVMVNFQIWKDVLNMLFPIFLYRKLYEKTNLQASELKVLENGYPKNAELFESQYRFSGLLLEESEIKDQKLEVRVKVGLVYCFYRETSSIITKQNLSQEVEKKILDSDNFSKQCFCGIDERGIYAQIHNVEWQQVSAEFNLSIGEVKAGLLSVVNSKIQSDIKPILIGDNIRVQQSIQIKKQIKGSESIIKNRIFIPKIRFVVELPALISFIDMTKKVVAVIDSLQCFKKNLSAKLLIMEQEMSNRHKLGKEKAHKDRVLELFVGEVQFKMLLISTFLKGVFFRKKGGEQELKLESIAIGLTKKLDVRIGQFRNQLVTQQYPLTQKYSGIKDTQLILQIGRQSKFKNWNTIANEPKNKRKLQRKLQFFETTIQKQPMNLWVIIKQKIESGPEKRDSKAFHFEKARKNSIIEEQKHIKDITILPMLIHIHASNLAFLLQHKKQIEDIFKEVGKVLQEIREDSKDIIKEHRDSIESENEVTTEISVNLKDLQVNLDIKPDFQYNETTGLRIMSNTRMFVSINIPKLQVIANPDSQVVNPELNLNVSAYFLHFLDKDIEINPLLINLNDLEDLGFRKILDLNGIFMKANINGKANISQVSGGIDSIKVDLCITTIPYLKLFLDHFINHSLNGNYGSDEESNFIILDDEPNDDEQPEDLTQKLQEYQQLLEEKKKSFSQFLLKQFWIKEGDGPRMFLKSFIIGTVRVKLFGGNEFKFVECNSMYESKATKRCRSESPDLFNFISLALSNFRVTAQKNEKLMQLIVELERLELQLSYKRKEGLIWGAEKDYVVNLLKINSPLKILGEISSQSSKIKLNTLQMTASITDEVFSLAEQFSKASLACEKSNWKRYYQPEKIYKSSKKMVLVILPEGRITASAEFKRAKLLNERVLKLQELIIHEQQSNNDRIMKLFKDWSMKIFTSNLGTLVSGALFEVLSTCIGLLFGGIRQILAIFFPKLKE